MTAKQEKPGYDVVASQRKDAVRMILQHPELFPDQSGSSADITKWANQLLKDLILATLPKISQETPGERQLVSTLSDEAWWNSGMLEQKIRDAFNIAYLRVKGEFSKALMATFPDFLSKVTLSSTKISE